MSEPEADWVDLKLKDRRLKGWRVRAKHQVRAGTVATVLDVEYVTLGEGLFAEDALAATVRLETPGFSPRETVVLFEPAARADLRSLAEAVSYLDEVRGDRGADEVFAELVKQALASTRGDPPPAVAAGKGPPLDLGALEMLLRASAAWRAAADAPETRDSLEAAYMAGRAMRQAEVPADLGRARNRPNAARRRREAEEWQADCAAWAQSIVDDWPATPKLSNTQLANKMFHLWAQRPFSGGPESCSWPRLCQDLIPAWKAAGTLRYP